MAEDEKTPEQHKKELIVSYSLTIAMLNSQVLDRNIARLVRIITERERLARQLLNSQADRETVDRYGHTEDQKKNKMLEIWRERNGNTATFDKLIAAMLEEGQRRQAENVCKMLNPGQ